MSNRRTDIQADIGTRLYFEDHNTTYEISGNFPLNVGEVLSIQDQDGSGLMNGYKKMDWEPPRGQYRVETIDPPVLFRYNAYNPNEGDTPNRGDHDAVRLSRRITLRKIE